MFYPILIHSRHSEPPQGSFGGHDGFISQPLTVAAPGRPFSSSWVACKAISSLIVAAPTGAKGNHGFRAANANRTQIVLTYGAPRRKSLQLMLQRPVWSHLGAPSRWANEFYQRADPG